MIEEITLADTENRIDQLLLSATQILQNNSESAKLDAEILLAYALNKSRTWLLTWPDKAISETQLSAYQKTLASRQSGIPIAYITKQREFWLHTFDVSPEVLIPRPDTELLVEQCLKIIPSDKPVHVLELGTGSGAISVSIGMERPFSQITATDISKPALAIANNNAKSAGVSNINFVTSNWFSHLPAHSYDLIISNPPYVEQNDKHLNEGDVRFEPRLALTSGIDGLRDLRIIIDQAPKYLSNNAYLAVEHGYNQADDVQSILVDKQYFNIEHYKDLQANPRVTIAQFAF